MKNVVEHIFNGVTSPTGSTYDTGVTYVGSGNFIKQYTGATSSENYISPFPLFVGRPMEASTAIAGAYPWVYSFSPTTDWIFLVDNGTAAVTRRIILMEYNKTTNQFDWKGFVTASSGLTNLTVRGFRMGVYNYSTGTISANGTDVSGSGTNWTDIGFAVGSRIGFGDIYPSGITSWYEISSFNSNTGITLSTSAGTIPSGTTYVIEEIRAYISATAATTVANGGLFIIKGMNYSTFSAIGTQINLANTDNIRGFYWLKDTNPNTLVAPWGLAIDEVNSDFTEEHVYIPTGAFTTLSYFIYKFNVRAPLTGLTTGWTSAAYLYKTGAVTGALTGTLVQTNSCRIINPNHGPGAGVKSLYIAATSRIWRCPLSLITNGATNYLADSLVDVPPGGINTYPIQNIGSIEYSDIVDKLITTGTVSATLAGRCQIYSYNTTSNPAEIIFLSTDMQYDYSAADQSAPAHPTTNMVVVSIYSEKGYLYIIRNGTTNLLNQIYCLPLAAHRTWADTKGEYVITPKFSTPSAVKYYRVYVNADKQKGDSTFGVPTEEFDLLYRTAGISDNTGAWTLLSTQDYNLDGIVSNEIQFKIRFKVLGTWCIPARIYSIALIYEDSQTDSHYTPSVNKSNVTNRIFAYRQTSAWGSNIPNLRIRLYNASTGGNVLDDTVNSSSSGVWQYSTDGTNWNTWSSSADSVGNYIRYAATTLPDSIIVRALLTQ